MKYWRREVNKKLRHNSNIVINTCVDWDELILPIPRDCGDYSWDSPRDGCSPDFAAETYWDNYFEEFYPSIEDYNKGFRK
jgi:hypothetical protein